MMGVSHRYQFDVGPEGSDSRNGFELMSEGKCLFLSVVGSPLIPYSLLEVKTLCFKWIGFLPSGSAA